MDDNERAIIAGEAAVERAKSLSKQPRFSRNAESVFGSLIRWQKLAEDLQIPDYSAKSRTRDRWLQDFWMREPQWAGIVSQLQLINAGRGWTLTGGRNQVRKYTTILHEANQGGGWREYVKQQVLSYYTADINAITEIGRSGKRGPLRALFHVDPARCELMQDGLKYYPHGQRLQEWTQDDFFRMAANPSTNERFFGLGFSATSMAFELVKMLYGVLMHDQEKVGARMPQGLLLLDGIGEEQWGQALEAREVELDAAQRRYFGGLYVFFSEGMEQLDYKLIALSQLPTNFDRKTFIDQVMYGYALIVGMEPAEFWPVQYGSLGRGRETEVQHRKALTKGASEFTISYQEKLQRELPDSLLFEFAQRDAEGELLDAQVAQAWSDVAVTLAGGKTQGVPLVDMEYISSFLVRQGVWPEEWTEAQEESVATDTEEARSRLEVRRAAELFPDEPIVRYEYPSGRTMVLWDRGGDLLRRRFFTVGRQGEREVLYEGDDFEITEGDVDYAVAVARQRVGAEFAELLEAPVMEEERGGPGSGHHGHSGLPGVWGGSGKGGGFMSLGAGAAIASNHMRIAGIDGKPRKLSDEEAQKYGALIAQHPKEVFAEGSVHTIVLHENSAEWSVNLAGRKLSQNTDGYYMHRTRVVHLGSNSEHTFHHEIGHGVFNARGGKGNQHFVDKYNRNPKFDRQTEYAKTSSEEAFCDCYAMWRQATRLGELKGAKLPPRGQETVNALNDVINAKYGGG